MIISEFPDFPLVRQFTISALGKRVMVNGFP